MIWSSGTLARQVAFIALGSVLIAHLIAATIFVTVPPNWPLREVEWIAPLLRVVAAASPADRDAIAAAARRAQIGITLGEDAQPDSVAAKDERSERVRAETAVATGLAPSALVMFDTPSGRRFQAQLPDGARVAFAVPSLTSHVRNERFWIRPVLTDLVVAGVPLALISLWAARRVSGPLQRLADAARHLQAIDDPAPLPEEGPREICEVSRALNALVDKLHRFVLDRTRMLAAISHDLRTPLTRLRLRLDSVSDSVVREKMLRDMMRMEAMITSTLAFIREDELQERVEPVDIAVLAVTVCDAFVDSGAEVAYDGPLHWPALCRPQAMERALTNLVDNAVKFGGTARVTLLGATAGVMIDVEDEGPGIADEDKAEVFKPFTRGDRARPLDQGGTGLGLTIAKSIVQSHGGSIELNDLTPNGLRVRVYLPRAA